MGMRVCFIHGWASSSLVWQPLKSCFADHRYKCSCLALPWIAPANEQQTLIPLNHYISQLTPELLNTDVIVGWSLGGLIAAAFIQQYSNWSGRLVLISAPLKFVSDSRSAAGINKHLLETFMQNFERSPKRVIDRFVALEAQGDEYMQSCRKTLRSSLKYNESMKSTLMDGLKLLQQLDYRCVMSKEELKPIVIHGENDQVVPWQASERMCRGIDTCAFQLIAASGHAPHVSHPQQVAEFIQANIAGGT